MMFRRSAFIITVFLLVSGIAFFSSCRKKDKVDTNPTLSLNFSTDTVFFDTVFTTVGSVTKRLMVYNHNSNKLSISSISLAGGNTSNFKINIDGRSSSSVSDVEIPAGDSLFIFVQVTVDPNNQNTPLIISDSLKFVTNGNRQDVKLVAWGQDAHFYKNVNLEGSVTWDSLKPHVIYGYLRVDTGADLTIMPGTKIYFHKNSGLYVSSQSTLKVIGLMGQEVRFQGDRLDPFYRDLPDQWDGIYLERGSKENDINYAIIKNGAFGIAVDSLGTGSNPVLKVNNTIIKNVNSYGIFAWDTYITSENCVIGDCGGSSIGIFAGGSYDFKQLTVGNYWANSVRFSPSVYISNWDSDTLGNTFVYPLTKAYFGNSILYGSSDEEIALDSNSANPQPFNASFEYCLLKTKLSSGHFSNCLKNKDPFFKNIMTYDYQLDSIISPAVNRGIPMGVFFDILGKSRDATPDLGAYEYVK